MFGMPVVFVLIGAALGHGVPRLFYFVFILPSDIHFVHEHLKAIREGINNDFYIDDIDISEIMTVRLELAYIEHISLADWAEIDKVRWWVRYLRQRARQIESEMALRTGIYNDLKESNPDGILVSTAEFDRKIQEAQQKDQRWENGLDARFWTDRRNRVLAYQLFLRDYFLCEDRLVPASYEEVVRKRYYVEMD